MSRLLCTILMLAAGLHGATPPDAPAFTATAQPFGGPALLSWSLGSAYDAPLAGTQVEASLDGSSYGTVLIAPPWSTSQSLALGQSALLDCGVGVTLRARAFDALSNSSLPSATQWFYAPCAPGLQALGLNAGQLTAFMAPGAGAGVSSLELRSAAAPGAPYAAASQEAVAPGSLTVLAATVPVDESRWYRAYAFGANGITSAASVEVAVLAPPSGLTATALATGAVVSWARPGTVTAMGLSGFELRYGSDPGLAGATVLPVPDPGAVSSTVSVTVAAPTGSDLYYAVASVGGSPGSQRGALSAIQLVKAGLAVPRIQWLFNDAGQALSLSWTASPGAVTPVAYTVYRAATAGGPGVAIGTTPGASIDGLAPVTEPGTAYFRVMAVDAAASQSPGAPWASDDVEVTALAAPTAPIAVLEPNRVSLSWSPVPGATQYRVYRATAGLPAPQAFFSRPEWLTTGLQALDPAPVNGTTNAYLVEAQATLPGAAGASASRSPLTSVLPWVAPGLPGRVTRTATTGYHLTCTASTLTPGDVDLSWEPSEMGSAVVTDHELWRGTNLASMTLLATLPVPVTVYTDTTAPAPLSQLFYAVRGIDQSSVAGAFLTGTVAAATPSLATVALSAAAQEGKVSLSWPLNAGAIDYKVYASATPLSEPFSAHTPVLTVTSLSASMAVTVSAADLSTWYYYVAVSTSAGLGLASEQSLAALPARATGLTATAGYGVSPEIDLAWSDPPNAAPASYDVYRSLDGATWSFRANVSSPGYSEASLAPDTPYYYQVRSVPMASGPVTGPIRTYGPPSAPAQLRAAGSRQSIDLSWSAALASEGVQSYQVHATDFNGSAFPVSTVPATQHSFHLLSDTALTPVGLGISFTVQAVNSAGASVPSAIVAAAIQGQGPVAAPQGVTVSVGFIESAGLHRAVLHWTPDNSGASAIIYRSGAPIDLGLAQGGSASAAYLTTVAGSSGQFTDSTVDDSSLYEYAVSFVRNGDFPWGETPPVPSGAARPFDLPALVSITAAATDGRIDLAWDAASKGTFDLASLPYRLYRFSFNGPAPSDPAKGDPGAVSFDLAATRYIDTDVVNGKYYYYLLSIVDDQGHESTGAQFPRQDPPNQASAKALRPQGPRRPPSAMSVVSGDNNVSLVWVALSVDALDGVKFSVYRRTTVTAYAGPLPHLDHVGPESTVFGSSLQALQTLRDQSNAASPLFNKRIYCYTMSALNEWGEGPKSAEYCVTPFRPLDPRLDASGTLTQDPKLSLSSVGSKDVALAWGLCRDQDPAEGYGLAAYRVTRSSDGGTTYQVLAELPAGTQSYVDTTTVFGSSYVYRVLPIDTGDNEGLAYTLAYKSIPSSRNGVLLYRNAFNPAQGQTLPWQVMAQQGGRTWVKVFTLHGEHVVTLLDEELPSASPDQPYLSVLKQWDGRNAQGQVVASGIYVIHMEAQGFRSNARVAVIK